MPRVSDEDIERAIHIAEGNVTAAAEILGITRQALYPRLRRLGYRLLHHGAHVNPVDDCPQCTPNVDVKDRQLPQAPQAPSTPVGKSEGVKWPRAARPPRLEAVRVGQTAALEVLEDVRHAAKLRQKQLQPARLSHENVERVQQHRLGRVQPELGYETTNSAVLDSFFNDCWPWWTKRPSEAKPKAPRARPKAKRDPGPDEGEGGAE